MALVKGTHNKAKSGAVLESLIPILRTASKTLVPGDDQEIMVDPTSAQIDFILPDAVSNPGVRFFLKRITNGTFVITLSAAGSDTIELTVDDHTLSLVNEYIEVISDGTTNWKIIRSRIFSIATMQATNVSFTVGTSLAKFTSWDTLIFNTPKKLVGDLTTNVIDILEFLGPAQDGYSVNITFGFIYTNNNTVTAQVCINGALTGIPVSVNALGAGKPTSISFLIDTGVVATGKVELQISAENAGSITNINALMRVSKLNP